MKAHVVSIHTDKENSFINRVRGIKSIWLGLRRVNNTWKWEDGTPFDYNQWDFLQPNRCCGVDVTCTKMNWFLKNGKWHDLSCIDESGVVCKYDPANRTLAHKNTKLKKVKSPSTVKTTLYKAINNEEKKLRGLKFYGIVRSSVKKSKGAIEKLPETLTDTHRPAEKRMTKTVSPTILKLTKSKMKVTTSASKYSSTDPKAEYSTTITVSSTTSLPTVSVTKAVRFEPSESFSPTTSTKTTKVAKTTLPSTIAKPKTGFDFFAFIKSALGKSDTELSVATTVIPPATKAFTTATKNLSAENLVASKTSNNKSFFDNSLELVKVETNKTTETAPKTTSVVFPTTTVSGTTDNKHAVPETISEMTSIVPPTTAINKDAKSKLTISETVSTVASTIRPITTISKGAESKQIVSESVSEVTSTLPPTTTASKDAESKTIVSEKVSTVTSTVPPISTIRKGAESKQIVSESVSEVTSTLPPTTTASKGAESKTIVSEKVSTVASTVPPTTTISNGAESKPIVSESGSEVTSTLPLTTTMTETLEGNYSTKLIITTEKQLEDVSKSILSLPASSSATELLKPLAPAICTSETVDIAHCKENYEKCVLDATKSIRFKKPSQIASSPTNCLPRKFGEDSIVCICNASFCDSFPSIGELKPHRAAILKSTKSGHRFKRSYATFAYSRKKARDVTFIKLDERKKYQSIIGFGGAFTDAVGINLNSLTKPVRNALLEAYFSQRGLRYNLGNVPIGSNSFSTNIYSYAEDADDFKLDGFNLTEEDYELKMPYIRQARQLAQTELKLFATPWSAPAWMKDSGSILNGGALKKNKEYQKVWADYLLRFLDEYLKNGIPIWGLSMQNQPQTGSTKPWQSMYYSPEMERNFIKCYLGPALHDSVVGRQIALMVFDDILELLPDWVNKVFSDKEVSNFVCGVAVQWYKGNSTSSPRVLSDLKKTYPDKFVLNTQAANGYAVNDMGISLGNWTRAELYAQNIIEDLNNFVSGWTDFNLCLDMEGGPSLVDHPFDAPILVNATDDEFYKQPMYYALAHFRYLPPESVRISSMVVKNNENLDATAFLTPFNQKVLILNNRGDIPKTLLINDRSMKGRNLEMLMEPHSIATIIWKQFTRFHSVRYY